MPEPVLVTPLVPFCVIGTLKSRSVAGALSVALAVLAGPIAARWVGNAITPPASLVTAFAAWSFVLACGMAFSYFWNGMHMLRLQAVLGGMFVLVGLPVKVAALQSGTATSVVLTNAIAYFATALLPGAIVTWAAIRAAAPLAGRRAAGSPTA